MNRHDIGLLQALDVLLTEGNVTRAAERLAVSQPALSAQLARLREKLGDPLLIPSGTGRGLQLTPRALALRAPLHSLLGELRRLVEAPASFDPGTAQREFHIAMKDSASSMIGLDLAAWMHAHAPGIRLSFRQVQSAHAFDAMSRGELDLIIGTESSFGIGTRRKRLLSDRFQVAQRKRHPRGLKRMTMKQYTSLRHIIASGAGAFRSNIDDQLGSLGMKRTVALSVQYYAMMPALLQRTDCIATLPARFLAQFRNQLDFFDLPFKMDSFQLSLGWHPRHDDDPGNVWLRALIEQLVLNR